jgi:NAD-reducing hydrogenase large subunit
MNPAQVVPSHALSFFHLSSPDLLFGFDAEPGGRHLLGVLGANPQLARDGIGLRRFGQQVIESLGAKRIHPAWIVSGGVDAPLSAETRAKILAALPETRAATERALSWYKASVQRFAEEATRFGDFPSAFLGLVGPDGAVEHYHGALRVVGADGVVLAERADPRPNWEYLGEAVEPWSYLKSAYWKELGYPGGVYRVGPLARLNVADRMGTPRADEELERFRGRLGRTPSSSFHYHQARLIEILSCLEGLEALLRGPEILSTRIRSAAGINRGKASAWPRRPAAPCCTITGSTATASSSGPTWSSPPATTTCHEPQRGPGGPPLRQGRPADRAHAQPGRGRDPLLRPLPELLHPCHRADAAAAGPAGPRRRPGPGPPPAG